MYSSVPPINAQVTPVHTTPPAVPSLPTVSVPAPHMIHSTTHSNTDALVQVQECQKSIAKLFRIMEEKDHMKELRKEVSLLREGMKFGFQGSSDHRNLVDLHHIPSYLTGPGTFRHPSSDSFLRTPPTHPGELVRPTDLPPSNASSQENVRATGSSFGTGSTTSLRPAIVIPNNRVRNPYD